MPFVVCLLSSLQPGSGETINSVTHSAANLQSMNDSSICSTDMLIFETHLPISAKQPLSTW